MNYTIDENKNLVNIYIQELAFNAAHPVGEIYIQYPGKLDPQTLYGRGTWDNISSEFAGLFFRSEGGNAEPFIEEGDIVAQEDKIRNITGWANIMYRWPVEHADDIENLTADVSGAIFSHWKAASKYHPSNMYSDKPLVEGNLSIDANVMTAGGSNPMAGHADGPEIRPVNTTIRIWERTG